MKESLGEKKIKLFLYGPFLFLTKFLSKCPSSIKFPISLKNSPGTPVLRHYSFCKWLHIRCLTVLWMLLFLDNCSVICTEVWWYVLHQIHSELWHVWNSVYSGIYKHIQAYSRLLRHIQAFWGYSCFFTHIQHPA